MLAGQMVAWRTIGLWPNTFFLISLSQMTSGKVCKLSAPRYGGMSYGVHYLEIVILSQTSQFDRDAENSGMEVSVSDKGVLLFNQALIHMRVSTHITSPP